VVDGKGFWRGATGGLEDESEVNEPETGTSLADVMGDQMEAEKVDSPPGEFGAVETKIGC